MARKNHNELAVGLTVLVVLALTVYLVIVLGDWKTLMSPSQLISVKVPYQKGVKGLTKGSAIHLGGVKIGTVTDVKVGRTYLEQTYDDVYAFFTMKMPQEYQLKSDCVLMPQCGVLGGQAILSIEDLGKKGDLLTDGQVVEMALADCVMDALKREFNPDNKDGFFVKFTTDITEITDKTKTAITKVEDSLEKVDATFETAKAAIIDIQSIIKDERIDTIFSNVTEVSSNLKLTTQEVRRAPWKLLYKPKGNEFKVQCLVDSAAAFSAGAERLDSTAIRLNALLKSPAASSKLDGKKVEAMLTELQTSFDQFKKVEQKFWNELK